MLRERGHGATPRAPAWTTTGGIAGPARLAERNPVDDAVAMTWDEYRRREPRRRDARPALSCATISRNEYLGQRCRAGGFATVARVVARSKRVSVDSERRAEILDAAAALFASSGLRASLQQIADACGILPGSLYHHFDSKEEIFIALVERYQAELDEIAEKAVEEGANPRPPDERIVALGTAIAECAVRHRAALLLTVYEPPAGASEEMVRLVSRTPAAINAAMLAILKAARSSGYLRREVDLDLLADRICQAMFHVGIGVSHRTRGGERVPAIRCRMLLKGLAVRPPDDARLDRSKARRAADEAIQSWDEDDVAGDGGQGGLDPSGCAVGVRPPRHRADDDPGRRRCRRYEHRCRLPRDRVEGQPAAFDPAALRGEGRGRLESHRGLAVDARGEARCAAVVQHQRGAPVRGRASNPVARPTARTAEEPEPPLDLPGSAAPAQGSDLGRNSSATASGGEGRLTGHDCQVRVRPRS